MTGPTDTEVERAVEALRTNHWYIVADMMLGLKRRAEKAERHLLVTTYYELLARAEAAEKKLSRAEARLVELGEWPLPSLEAKP